MTLGRQPQHLPHANPFETQSEMGNLMPACSHCPEMDVQKSETGNGGMRTHCWNGCDCRALSQQQHTNYCTGQRGEGGYMKQDEMREIPNTL